MVIADIIYGVADIALLLSVRYRVIKFVQGAGFILKTLYFGRK
tara:strand:- start:674 stop:802 length:129 start_codon:yes stop_codon:yes gene_type:complete